MLIGKNFLVVIDRQIRKKPQISVRVGIKYREGMLKKMSRFYILTTAVLSRTKAKAKAESTNPVVKNAKI